MEKEIYGCLVENTLTIYYDEKKSSRDGQIFSYNEVDIPEWAGLREPKICNIDSSVAE